MALMSLTNVSVAFGGPKVLENISLQIEKNQRICLLGKNGSGKSTILKIISGILTPDTGSIVKENSLRITILPQHVPDLPNQTVYDVIASAFKEHESILKKMYASKQPQTSSDTTTLIDYHRVHDTTLLWKLASQIDKVISQTGLNPDAYFSTISGGMKRRVLLAKALVIEPDLLLLDEPTNHLDIDSITWMEEYLLKFKGSLIFVTHDRSLLKKIATRIIEIDRAQLFDWSCTYDIFLERKQQLIDSQQKEWDKFDKKLTEEEVWIRKGLKARRTRNEGRVAALERMRQQRSLRRELAGDMTLTINSMKASGKIVLELKNISFAYGEKKIISDFSTTIIRGDKIGIVGTNGSGKTTLLNILTKNLSHDSGDMKLGTSVSTIYFDQLRQQLDDSKTVWENVIPYGDTVFLQGKPKHIIAYLEDFLFTPQRARTPVAYLSGGEKNRLLFARLFAQPSNLLILDEPTNDLDIETLELLEDALLQYEGTVILVSHDRTFLNTIATSILSLDGTGNVIEYAGGYDEWALSQQKIKTSPATPQKQITVSEKLHKQQTKKLSYNQKKELAQLPAQIEDAENELEQIHANLADPLFYRSNQNIGSITQRMHDLETHIQELYKQWEYLSSLE